MTEATQPSLPALLGEASPEEIFMPEGLCSRCGEEEPKFHFLFSVKAVSLPNKTTNLGFCSQECFVAFCEGIEGARTMRA